jgi:hypothetical protein
MLPTVSLLAVAPFAVAPDAGVAVDPPVLELMAREAKAYAPQVKSPWVKQFMTALTALPHQPKLTFFCKPDRGECFRDRRSADLQPREADEDVYYGRITEPMGYARPLDVLAAQGFTPKGRSVLDFGYGNIGQLEALVSLGATAAGIEVDPLLPLLYEKANRPALRIHHGFFPSDAALVKAVGEGYDVFLSKNTLKKGYVHPDRALTPEQEKRQLKLGVSDEQFVERVFALLKPGGYFFIYNICPPETPRDQPFVPWTDGRSPFARETYERAGFEVIAFDADDTKAVREMARAFAWEDGDTFVAKYTLLRKRAARP